MGTILKIVLSLLSIFGTFMNPEDRDRRRKQALLRRMETLEQAYGRALLDGDPKKAMSIDYQLRELRRTVRYLDVT